MRTQAWLLLSVPLLVVSLSGTAISANLNPTLFLEIYGLEEDSPDSALQYVCTHPAIPYSPYLPCSAAKSPYGLGILTVHVGKLDQPACPTIGPECEGYGGYAGLCFGIIHTGQPAVFMRFTACPGFLVGYSGSEADVVVSTTGGCHDWPDHAGYMRYANASPDTGRTYFRIVENSDLGFVRVINCSMEYDLSTDLGGCAGWGGTAYDPFDCYQYNLLTYFCQFTPVKSTSWGAIKSLFR